MIEGLNPALILIFGAALIPLLPADRCGFGALALPLLALLQLWGLPQGEQAQVQFIGYTLTTLRIDRLSFVFALIFHVAAFLNALYALHLRDSVQHVAGLVYAGAAIGAVLAGDLITLFVYWELTAISSVFLIWARRSERAVRAGLRYLIIQVASGVLLLAGAVLLARETGSIAFGPIGLDGLAGVLLFLAFGIKCAFPLLHSWLQDAYPEATVTGAVVLSVFTTKLAVYALARGFAGTEVLIGIGAVMTVFPLLYAVIENDLRRMLAYVLNNQLGFMVVGIGIGTELALNGMAAHAFAHILYESLLFMTMGAVLYRTGTAKATELGGLYRCMPYTTVLCLVGAASISAVPLFSGFVSKSLILSAAAKERYEIIWLVLLFASTGVFWVAGIKLPYRAFFGRGRGIRCQEAPASMRWAMAITAFLCFAIGLYPLPLYALLPYPMEYQPYTFGHLIAQFQLLAFSALAFAVAMGTGLYPLETRSTNLDVDWVYRQWLPARMRRLLDLGGRLRSELFARVEQGVQALMAAIYRHHGPQGTLARTWPIGSMVLWVAILLGACLILYYV